VPDQPIDRGGRALAEQYEQLRDGVLAGHADGWRRGLGVLSGKGVAAWMRVAGPAAPARLGSAATPRQPPCGALAGEVVAVLAEMALAHA
jgi:hypothetical protein